jgi:hypothetical protein
MRRALVPALAVVLGGAAPTAASAAEPGVHVDPGSPAGKEYALPLDQVRRDARGGGGSTAGGSSGAGAQKSSSARPALFGEGIKPSNGHGAGKTQGGAARGGSGDVAPGSEAARRLSAPATASSGSPALTDGGIALAVLLAAGALGLLFRRVLR